MSSQTSLTNTATKKKQQVILENPLAESDFLTRNAMVETPADMDEESALFHTQDKLEMLQHIQETYESPEKTINLKQTESSADRRIKERSHKKLMMSIQNPDLADVISDTVTVGGESIFKASERTSE